MFVILGQQYGTKVGGKVKEKDRKSTVPKCSTSVHVEDITLGTESC
jgi:hypothetical protein